MFKKAKLPEEAWCAIRVPKQTCLDRAQAPGGGALSLLPGPTPAEGCLSLGECPVVAVMTPARQGRQMLTLLPGGRTPEAAMPCG